MTEAHNIQANLPVVIAATPFDTWLGLDLIEAADGVSVVSMSAKPELMQQSRFLHAGVIAALIDHAAGFAVAPLSGSVLTSNFQITSYRPAVGQSFEAHAKGIRAARHKSLSLLNALRMMIMPANWQQVQQ